MVKKKNTFCADTSKMSDTEKKIMANAMKAGEEQINIIRDSKTQESEKPKEERESEE